MDTINDNSGEKLNKVLLVAISSNLPTHENHQLSQKDGTYLSLADSIHAQKDHHVLFFFRD